MNKKQMERIQFCFDNPGNEWEQMFISDLHSKPQTLVLSQRTDDKLKDTYINALEKKYEVGKC